MTCLYHGSKGGLVGSIAPTSRDCCDFGRGFYLWPTPAKWRNGVENELLQQAEMMVRNVVGEKIAIDVGE